MSQTSYYPRLRIGRQTYYSLRGEIFYFLHSLRSSVFVAVARMHIFYTPGLKMVTFVHSALHAAGQKLFCVKFTVYIIEFKFEEIIRHLMSEVFHHLS